MGFGRGEEAEGYVAMRDSYEPVSEQQMERYSSGTAAGRSSTGPSTIFGNTAACGTCVVLCAPCTCPCSIAGLYIKRGGQMPFDETRLEREGGKYATTTTGRRVEYFCFGDAGADARTCIFLHGSSLTGHTDKVSYEGACTELGVRGIAVTWGGHGMNDINPGRLVKDWPTEDLAAVLIAESVDRFMVVGHSSGTAHAMASAWAYPERCTGIALHGSMLPGGVTEDFGLPPVVGSKETPTVQELNKCTSLWYVGLMGIMGATGLVEAAASLTLTKEVKAEGQLTEMLKKSLARGMVRGVVGPLCWETASDTCNYWGFDPRDIQCKNVVVWHAEDDKAVTVAYARWLVKVFEAKGAYVSSRFV